MHFTVLQQALGLQNLFIVFRQDAFMNNKVVIEHFFALPSLIMYDNTSAGKTQVFLFMHIIAN
jgi:hypothetical protein